MHYSSITRRFLAMILDWLVLFIPFAVLLHAIPVLGGLLILFFYYPIFESSKLMSTPGKHWMGIQVQSLSGARLNFREACLRLVMKLISAAACFIGHLLAFFTQRKQAFHDLVAGSVVVFGRQEVSIADAWIEQVRAVFGAMSKV